MTVLQAKCALSACKDARGSTREDECTQACGITLRCNLAGIIMGDRVNDPCSRQRRVRLASSKGQGSISGFIVYTEPEAVIGRFSCGIAMLAGAPALGQISRSGGGTRKDGFIQSKVLRGFW